MKAILFSILLITLAFAGAVNAQKIVTEEDAVKNALKVGDKAPAFALKDSTGKLVESKRLRKNDNLVVVFYRGSWCPFCNTYLRTLQKRLPDIEAAGGKLVAISVEEPDASMAVAKKNDVAFTVLSDPKLETARKFGIVFQLSPETDAQYKGFGLDIAGHNKMEKPELPLAATFVVNKKGKIVYAFVEKDYKKRAEPDAIIAVLEKLK